MFDDFNFDDVTTEMPSNKPLDGLQKVTIQDIVQEAYGLRVVFTSDDIAKYYKNRQSDNLIIWPKGYQNPSFTKEEQEKADKKASRIAKFKMFKISKVASGLEDEEIKDKFSKSKDIVKTFKNFVLGKEMYVSYFTNPVADENGNHWPRLYDDDFLAVDADQDAINNYKSNLHEKIANVKKYAQGQNATEAVNVFAGMDTNLKPNNIAEQANASTDDPLPF